MVRFFAIGLMVASTSVPVWSSVPASEYSAELKKWLDSPVRYVATTPEIKAFKKLKTDNARAAFIEAFWARRDPEPDTLVNEYRQAFWERVRETQDLFFDGAKPGNFEQATEVVCVGRYTNGKFHAKELLVKCPSKYMEESANL